MRHRLKRRVTLTVLAVRRHFGVLKAIIPALVALVLLSVVGLAIRNSQEKTNLRESEQITAGCERLNLLEATANRHALNSWAVFRVVLLESQSAPQPKSRTQQRQEQRFLAPLRTAVATETWTPSLNCSEAVRRHGASYVLPQPIPFDRVLPPASAISP